jgi:23S rRNA maturation-related 3'-5' exoribonuclease YhaM
MNDDIPRSIRFPKKVWDAIDADAQRCKRSSVKQMEAVLTAYYQLEDVELNQQSLEMLGELMPHSRRKIPMIEMEMETAKKKKVA